jgi:hypothetical protein
MVLPPKSGIGIKIPIKKPLAKAIKRELPAEHPTAPGPVDVNRDNPEVLATSSKDNLPSIDVQASKPIKTHIGEFELARGMGDHIYIMVPGSGNPQLLRVGSKTANLFLRRIAQKREITLRDRDIKEIVETLEAYAEMELQPVDIYLRTAPFQEGYAIDLGDDQNSRVIIQPGKVEVVTSGCDVLFRRSSITQPFARPANKGNLKLLKKYLRNLRPEMQQLLIGWITYTLACPKIPSRNFVLLSLVGPEGSGKSFTCKLISDLTDPNSLALQKMPKNSEDLVVAANYTLVLIFDNGRTLTFGFSDSFAQCITGASSGKRQLFTNGELYVSYMHVAIVINSINHLITEPDLIQRSLIMPVKGFEETDRVQNQNFTRNGRKIIRKS